MSFQGAAIEDLTVLRSRFVDARRTARDAAEYTTGLVRAWQVHGPAGDELREDVNALRVRLGNSAGAVDEIVRRLGQDIDEQRRASAGGVDGVGEPVLTRSAQLATTEPAPPSWPHVTVDVPPGLLAPLDPARREARAREVFGLISRTVPELAGKRWEDWDPRRGFTHNEPFVRAGYEYYAGLFADRPQLHWAGMAKLAGTVVYAGFEDMRMVRDLLRDTSTAVPESWPITRRVAEAFAQLTDQQIAHFENKFLEMHQAVFLDLAFQHEAYRREGVGGIERLANNGDLPRELVDVWRMIDSSEPATVAEGNRLLLLREQKQVLQPFYDEIVKDSTGQIFTQVISATTQSPIPGGAGLLDGSRGGNVAVFDDRWSWIQGDMLPKYEQFLASRPGEAKELIGRSITDASDRFRISERLTLPVPALK
ncbi:hypothetical protein BLA60_17995 [Actinophytocola xinjiangensis]|uniref:WXG100 family type VII secretion target n=1 Tax=Actinophytocola xinjiangensis TaxID=485602 RepID=A0A7Z1AX34_9PSEU|nr:hypothetical protein [Actinophytocola xinjiangensis]OLF09685.1 hypothetical protein BLA60_17995 [Actinophytocola xinjiangensis]